MTATRVKKVFWRRTPIRNSPEAQTRTRLPEFDVLHEVKNVCLPRTEQETSNREPDIHKSIPSMYLGSVHLIEGRKKYPNVFISLIFIHLWPSSTPRTGPHPPPTTPRRVLLDTGADFNLISHGAHTQLGLNKRAYRERVHSIAGYTELEGAVVLEWHFRRHGFDSGQPLRPHGALFYVLPREIDAKFDCILGRPWIEENWVEFIAQVELNRRRELA